MTVYSGEKEDVEARILQKIFEEKTSGKRVGVLATDDQICYYKGADIVLSLGPENAPEEHARRLFDALRKFDEEGADAIYAYSLGLGGVDNAVMNRMFRAAGGTIEEIGPEKAVTHAESRLESRMRATRNRRISTPMLRA